MKSFKQSTNNEDLRLIAPKLAVLPKCNIDETFSIPVGYFEKMREEVLMHPFVNATFNFEVPALYFEQLPELLAQHALVSKKNPFVIPENYFDQVSHQVAQKAGIATIQANLEVPEGYFENLPIKIQDKLYREQKRTKVFWLPQAPHYRLAAVAAMIALLVAMVFYLRLFDNPTANNTQLAMNKLSESTINAATEEVQDYEESMLIEEIDQPEQIEIASNDKQQQYILEITEYLIENDITLEDIAEEI